jgi:hypothetical protein|tara:strand:+ start:2464 stop:2793 length:330 start_codon:yes stop_codon:yes gene_type:complete
MATFFRNKVINQVGTVPIDVLVTNGATRATIIGCSLANLTSSNVLGSVTISDDTSVTGFYIKDIIIPPNSTLKVLNGGEKLILAPDNKLSVVCTQTASLDCILSYVEIT